MGIKFRYNDKTYSLYNDNWDGSSSSPDYLMFTSLYSYPVPASADRGPKIRVIDNGSVRRYIDNSAPTICFRKNGKTYYCAKSLTQVYQRTVSYDSNGGSGSMDSQTFYPDDDESVTIKENGFTRSGYLFEKWNTSPDGSGTSYNAGSTYKGNGMTLYAQWKSIFSATNWAYAYSSSNVWHTTYSGKTIYHWEEHIYTISVKVTAPSTNVYDFIVVLNSGLWSGSLVSNPDIPMNGSTTKTLSVQVRFRASAFGGDPATHLVIDLRDRTNSVNTVVSRFTVNTYLSFGTTDSEE